MRAATTTDVLPPILFVGFRSRGGQATPTPPSRASTGRRHVERGWSCSRPRSLARSLAGRGRRRDDGRERAKDAGGRGAGGRGGDLLQLRRGSERVQSPAR